MAREKQLDPIQQEEVKIKMHRAQVKAKNMVTGLDKTRAKFEQKMLDCEAKEEYEDAMFYLEAIEFLDEAKKFGERYADMIEMQQAVVGVLNMVMLANNTFEEVVNSANALDFAKVTKNIKKFSKIINKMKGGMQELSKAMRVMFKKKKQKGVSAKDAYEQRKASMGSSSSASTPSAPSGGKSGGSKSSGGSSSGGGIEEI